MATVNVERRFPVSADTLWERIGNIADVAAWIPAISSSRMEDDVRHVVFTDGEPARERIIEHLDAARTYTYQYIDGPLPLQHYQSTILVLEDGDDAGVVKWSADFGAESAEVEAGLVTAIEGIYSDALTELKAQVVGV
ncbi:MxaD family protein [Williamsia sp. 1138]|uniref:SRPBCC family protein n=1 Tax=Williamsia sp. 1138 TaxID=1903117 RepID=UPI000A11D43E|nr:SRPBCC family protein [Williamsia sp. 1138]OZG26489.1 MxaD family protein [Williamsia sp. 1138]